MTVHSVWSARRFARSSITLPSGDIRSAAATSGTRAWCDRGMRTGRGGHPCEVDTTEIGLWRCDVCGQQWEVHGVAGNPRVRKVSRIGWFIAKLMG